MRGWNARGAVVTVRFGRLGLGFALVALLAGGCSSAARSVRSGEGESYTEVRYIALDRLANDLKLHYRGEDQSGYIELSAPPDNVMLVEDSCHCLVNGKAMAMDRPCQRRGIDYVLSEADAARITRALAENRTARRTAPPPLDVAPLPPRTAPPSGLPSEWRPEASAHAWKYIVIHHMASPRGSAAAIHRIHMSKGWDGLGYHFVVGNGTLSPDGQVEVGYRWKRQLEGAHARVSPTDDNWWNRNSIGVCLIGDFTVARPTATQLEASARLVRQLQREYGIPTSRIIPHDAVKATLCPGPRFPWDDFIARLR